MPRTSPPAALNIEPPADATPYLRLALALSLGAAASLGIARFGYGLLLPPMRADLDWSYTLAGAMNTANAVGYLIGAMAMAWLLRGLAPTRLFMAGSVLATVFMAASGFFTDPAALLLQRLLAGVASGLVFGTGGLLAAKLGARQPQRSGLLIGLYYGGTGLGIALSAVLVPQVLQAAGDQPHPWAWGWWAMALLCALATLLLGWPARVLAQLEAQGPPPAVANQLRTPAQRRFRWRDFAFGLFGYLCFGMGYIGYMTFVIALLAERQLPATDITIFYTLLGVAVIASSRIWAGLLDRHRDGQPLARLNALLGVAAILPALTSAWSLVMISALLFGAVFLSVVASTTALVRHNLPASQWASGI
ncbi:MAG: YbfB/YjiJ family MFS transporter, partial [Quisquiliibacterium sp.]